MQILIEIDEKDYDFINNTSFVEDEGLIIRQTREDRKKKMILFDILYAVINGTSLPKNHGDLVDRNSLDFTDIDFYDPHCVYDVQNVVDNAPTVIEGSDSE